jgi:hypothetical protein
MFGSLKGSTVNSDLLLPGHIPGRIHNNFAVHRYAARTNYFL